MEVLGSHNFQEIYEIQNTSVMIGTLDKTLNQLIQMGIINEEYKDLTK